jgi:hypothetical protein
MKKFILLFTILISSNIYSQEPNPELFRTWYLISYSVDIGPTYFVSNVSPYISPTFILDQDLNITGQVCNEYGGYFSYDTINDKLILEEFSPCLCGTCNNPPQSHVNLENDYFGYFNPTMSYEYEVSINTTTNSTELLLFAFPGYILTYGTEPLSVNENSFLDFKIYPNPVLDKLYISSEGKQIISLTISSIKGEKVLENIPVYNQIDVSALSKGLYFIEINTSEGRSIEKFIKK